MQRRDVKAKESLARASDAIRRKFQQVRSAHMENKRILEEHYKPITKRLGQLIDSKVQKVSSTTTTRPANRNVPSVVRHSQRKVNEEQLHKTPSLRWDSLFDFADPQMDLDKKIEYESMSEDEEQDNRQTQSRNRNRNRYADYDEHEGITAKQKKTTSSSSMERDREHTMDFRRKQRNDVVRRRKLREQNQPNTSTSLSAVLPTSSPPAKRVFTKTDGSDVTDNDDANRKKLALNLTKPSAAISISSDSSISPYESSAAKQTNRDKVIRNRIADEARKLYHNMTEKRDEQARNNARRSPNLNELNTLTDVELVLDTEATANSRKRGKLSENAASDDSASVNILKVTPNTSKRSKNDSELPSTSIKKTDKQQKDREIRDRIADETRDFYHEIKNKRDEELRLESRREPNLYVLKAQQDSQRLLSPSLELSSAAAAAKRIDPLNRNMSVLMNRADYEDTRNILSDGDEQDKSVTKKKKAKKQQNRMLTRKASAAAAIAAAAAVPEQKTHRSRSPLRMQSDDDDDETSESKRYTTSRKLRSEKSHRGDGLIDLSMKQYKFDNSSDSYIYWDDPNELVNRLRLLIASTHAGHNAHHNEISSIIEELREAGIVE